MTAATSTMFMNMLTPNQQSTMFSTECTTPEIIRNILMENENPFNYPDAQQQQPVPQFPNYYLPEHMEAPMPFTPGPAAPYTGPEASQPVQCGPQLASSPPMPTSSLSPAGTTGTPNEPEHLYHQLVKTELKYHICQRRQAHGSPVVSEAPSYTAQDEVGWTSPTTFNNTITSTTNNTISATNNNISINCTAIENSFNYKPCPQSLSSPDDCFYYSGNTTLTPADEFRRRKRRERNKIAATKCRNKKKEKTAILVKESELLQHENNSMKTEITKLQEEIRKLTHLLGNHRCKLHNQQSVVHNQQPVVHNQQQSSMVHNHNPLYSYDMYACTATAGSAL